MGGCAGDGHHITAPEGRGARRAMECALREGGIAADEVGYVNAHATSTPLGDAKELEAIAEVLQGSNAWVSSTKGAMGHLLGAAGAIEAVLTVQALTQQMAPPNLNLQQPIQVDGVRLVGVESQALDTDHGLSNSFGFGGVCSSLLFSRV